MPSEKPEVVVQGIRKMIEQLVRMPFNLKAIKQYVLR
jgi:hypothetical protein